jgi:CheY-like chemotaxis protein
VVENREKAIALGADAFHTKPVDRLWLMQRLEDLAAIDARPVLIIDDDEVSRYVVKTILGGVDFRFTEASSGQEGLRRAREGRPEVIILDLSMPDMSGFEVLKYLKADSRTAAVPVIVHTSKVLDADERALLSDAVAVISKESKSRALSREKFASAFNKAGLEFKAEPMHEEHHV